MHAILLRYYFRLYNICYIKFSPTWHLDPDPCFTLVLLTLSLAISQFQSFLDSSLFFFLFLQKQLACLLLYIACHSYNNNSTAWSIIPMLHMGLICIGGFSIHHRHTWYYLVAQDCVRTFSYCIHDTTILLVFFSFKHKEHYFMSMHVYCISSSFRSQEVKNTCMVDCVACVGRDIQLFMFHTRTHIFYGTWPLW